MAILSEQSGEAERSSDERMLDMLLEIREQVPIDHPYLGSSQASQLKQLLDGQGAAMPPSQRWVNQFRLAQISLQLGEEREAIRLFLECKELLGQAVLPEKLPAATNQLMFELGVAYMRWGETQNCCLRNHPDSCILPIRGQGVHTNTEGSEQAVKCFTYVLEHTEANDVLHLNARWLLNVAWMTLGKHPASVPEEFLIPEHAFVSEIPFPRFKNIAQELGIDTFSSSGGAIIDDFDNDNYLDLIVSPWDPRGQIKFFRNQGDGTFADRSEESGLGAFPGGLNMIQADYDNDGDTDVFVMRGAWLGANGRHPNSLMRNEGDGTFVDVTLEVGMTTHYPTQTAAWADYDNDGDLDLFIGNESGSGLNAPCQLYQNDGKGSFRDVANDAGVTSGGYAKGVVWGDFNADRFPDLFISNQGGKNRLLRNNRDGTFTNIAADAGVENPSMSFPAWFWDFNNDGKLDLYVSTYAASTGDLAAFYLGLETSVERSTLYQGDGEGGFIDVTRRYGLNRPDATMGANFGDIDNDGYLDFYLGTGYPKYESLMPSVMYLSRRGEKFVDITTAGGFGHLQKGHAVAFADMDNDGDQDLFEQMGGAFHGDRFHDAFYENPGQDNRWISLKLAGSRSNRSAIGARIRVDVREAGQTRTIYRHVNSGGTFGANPLRQTIGLGKATSIEMLEIYWPTSDSSQRFEDVELDRHYAITEDQDHLEWIELSPVRFGGVAK